jgi:hypothetical protein
MTNEPTPAKVRLNDELGPDAPLVERLRQRAHNGIEPLHELARLDMMAAATALERRCDEVENLKWELDATKRAREHTDAEAKRLRTALRAVLDDDDHDAAKNAARAALAGLGA